MGETMNFPETFDDLQKTTKLLMISKYIQTEQN